MGDNCLLLDQRSTIPSRFEEAIHAVIERTRELNKITLAVIYGQFPWETDSDDAEVQLALILDDDVTDFVATKLELTKTAYDVLVETGIEVAPFPVPVTHWYLPSKAANPSLIEDIRKHGLRINLDRIIARPPPPQVKARPIADIVRILQDVCEDLQRSFDVQGLYFVPQNIPNNPDDKKAQQAHTDSEQGPVDILVDFGGRPSTERVLGVQQSLESALQMPVQLLTTSSIRKSLLDLLLEKAINIPTRADLAEISMYRRASIHTSPFDDA